MTLRDVGVASKGVFKPTAVAGYERAERSISLERFCELARLYQMEPERLLAQIMWRAKGRPEPTVDRDKIQTLPSRERDVLDGFIRQVRRMRGLIDDGTITIRIHDLEVLATVSGSRLDEFLEELSHVLVEVAPEHGVAR
jgi:hypothetical protein